MYASCPSIRSLLSFGTRVITRESTFAHILLDSLCTRHDIKLENIHGKAHGRASIRDLHINQPQYRTPTLLDLHQQFQQHVPELERNQVRGMIDNHHSLVP